MKSAAVIICASLLAAGLQLTCQSGEYCMGRMYDYKSCNDFSVEYCESQQGCFLRDACSGIADCADNTQCSLFCDVWIAKCVGGASACGSLIEVDCGQQSGCSWDASSVSCVGIADDCSEMTNYSQCQQQSGCLEEEFCHGEVDCADISYPTCHIDIGCATTFECAGSNIELMEECGALSNQEICDSQYNCRWVQ